METLQNTPARVRILPPHIVNRIAAGEVVERPASVVKELVENSLDAGARRIEITASAGGRYIRIADDGSGMTPEDAQLAFYNHATSKISDETDLEQIHTLGFRGEALSSIAAISRLSCQTRTQEAESGSQVVVDSEGNPTVTPVGCAPGTIIEVADLFYNTPARLKFLKKPGTELSHMEEMVQHLALSHPEVQFSLMLQEKKALKTSGSGDFKITLEEVFKLKEDILQFIPVSLSDPEFGYELQGLVSTPDMIKRSRRWMITFVNGRSIKCHILNKAVEAAYESLVPHGRYPFSLIFLNLPLDQVDANVHPTKREVRYASPNTVFSFIKSAVKNALEANGHRAVFQPESFETSNPTQLNTTSPVFDGSLGSRGELTGIKRTSSPSSTSLSSAETQSALDFYQPGRIIQPDSDSLFNPIKEQQHKQSELSLGESAQRKLKVIGQLFNTYILLESPQGLMVVDQHIASERTFFEALMLKVQNIQTESPEVQIRLTSTPITFTPVQIDLLQSNEEAFNQIGFSYDITEFSVTLTGVPLIYAEREHPDPLFEKLVIQLEETGEMILDLDLMIATMACHSAVRAGDVLNQQTMELIIDQWLACQLPWTCPHGRPIAHTIKTDDLNHFFHRPSLPVNA